jgi:hypothetical protein
MAWVSRRSEKEAEFGAELNVNFAGPEGLDKAGV